jgi:hypothetical protein
VTDRRAFVRTETLHLGRFLDVPDLVGWRRSYRCKCGFRCPDPGGIWDHACRCGPGQLELPLGAVEARP